MQNQIANTDIEIRSPKNSADWAQIRKICCIAGGAKGSFFGDFWVGPYQRLLPGWAYITCQNGVVTGYLVGCPNSNRFRFLDLVFFKVFLFIRVIATGRWGGSHEKKFIKRFTKVEKSPEDYFSRALRKKLGALYPAHLHINLLEEARGNGVGQILVRAFLEDLRQDRVAGVHVFCGPGPVGFYTKCGFTVLETIQMPLGMNVYAMGMRL